MISGIDGRPSSLRKHNRTEIQEANFVKLGVPRLIISLPPIQSTFKPSGVPYGREIGEDRRQLRIAASDTVIPVDRLHGRNATSAFVA